MIVLGLNAFGHDAAAVLLVDGEVTFAASQERCDRIRHSAAFPLEAIHAAFRSMGLAEDTQPDAIAFPWTRGMGRLPKLLHVLRRMPRSLAYLREPPDALLPDRRGYLRSMVGITKRLRRAGYDAPVHRVPHHLAHAVSAALALPDRTGAVVTADGMGEWTTAATWDVRRGRPRRLRRAVYPHSAGKAYAAVTAWLGFRPESDEGKTMGLAAYGDPTTPAAAFTRATVRPHPTRLLTVRTEDFGFPWGEGRLYGDAFLARLGPARDGTREAIRDGDADAARGIQDAVTEIALEAARSTLEATGHVHLGLAGGLFLNCALNGMLREKLPCTVHPFPVAGDAGAAWGAAAWVSQRLTGALPAPLGTLRLGTDLTPEACRRALEGTAAQEIRDRDALAGAVAHRIRAGRIVAVARGRAEFGPRALGGRSVLASPTRTAVRDEVNRRKGREAWRPLAPVVRANDRRWFADLTPSPYMITTFRATEDARRLVPGGVHVDGTARVQTVDARDAPFLDAVLHGLAEMDAPPVVLNTSLNRRGEPIADTAEEALAAARAMKLDAIVLGSWLLDLEGST